MSRFFRYLFLAGIIFPILFAVYKSIPPKDPLCKGIPLSLIIENREKYNDSISDDDIRALGNDGVNYLIYYIEENRPRLSKSIGDYLPAFLVKYLHRSLFSFNIYGDFNKPTKAIKVLGIYKEKAKPAIDSLVKSININTIELTCISFLTPSEPYLRNAAKTLHYIGPDSWHVVENALQMNYTGTDYILYTLSDRLSKSAATPTYKNKECIVDLIYKTCIDNKPLNNEPLNNNLLTIEALKCSTTYRDQTLEFNTEQRIKEVISFFLSKTKDSSDKDQFIPVSSIYALYYFPEIIPLHLDSLVELATRTEAIEISGRDHVSLLREKHRSENLKAASEIIEFYNNPITHPPPPIDELMKNIEGSPLYWTFP